MAVTAKAYGLVQSNLANKLIDLTNDTIKVMLCTSSYTPNQDTHQYKTDVTNEVTGTGYTAGGATLASKAVTYDTATNTMKWTAANPSWASSTITARYAVFYQDTGTGSTSRLICYWDFGTNEVSTAAIFTLNIAAGGIITMTAA